MWIKRPAQWIDGDTAYFSVVFTWQLPKVWQEATWMHKAGYKVKVGGPGTYVQNPVIRDIKTFASVGGELPDAVRLHNPNATFASRGCPVGCNFCIVPSMEGREFTLLPDFPVRPVLCDNNLSALPADYQDHIISRYKETGVPLLDANSGFEPCTFSAEVYERWAPINRGPWRFALDDQGDLPYVVRVLDMLRDKVRSPSRKRVYVLIGNEPFDLCMARIKLVLDRGAEPHVQPIMKLNTLLKRPWIRFDWCPLCRAEENHRKHSDQLLRDVARWANRRYWRYSTFKQYQRSWKRLD